MPSITPAERDRLTNYLAVTRERVLNTARGLSSEQLGFKPSSDRWPVAENVENRVLSRIENALGGSDVSKRSAWEGRETDADLRGYCSRHSVLGDLDCYQWLLAAGAHCERHLAQIDELLASAGFPCAAVGV